MLYVDNAMGVKDEGASNLIPEINPFTFPVMVAALSDEISQRNIFIINILHYFIGYIFSSSSFRQTFSK